MSEYVLKAYTRKAEENKYPNGLAYSVHLAIIDKAKEIPLNNNYGVLFPKASIDERNVILPKYVGKVKIAKSQKEDVYYITGEDVLSDGTYNQKSEGFLWSWITNDFITYVELGLLETEILVKKSGINIFELRNNDSISITEDTADKLIDYWNPLSFKEIVNDIVYYSDGSSHKKDIPGYPSLEFPLARGFADPVILLWKDEYYFIATNDNRNDIGLYVRKANKLDDLFKEDVTMHLILDKDEKRGLIQTFWAPEFHVIDGKLFILFAVSNEQWGPQCHLMKLKENGDICKAEDWEDPVIIKRKGGEKLGEAGITLDMTYIKSGDKHYYAWSYRENIGTVLDSGSMIMIAEFSPQNPDELISDPVCLSRPLYGFENVNGTINNEGPYALYYDGKIYLTYSGGDARGYLYTIGMLTVADGDDLCDISSWEKVKAPVLHFASVQGEYGPGHNSFFCDRNGDWWIDYHAVSSYEEKVISTGIRRVHFDSLNRPRLDLCKEEDLPDI